MAKMSYNTLKNSLKTNDYTPRTDEQLRTEAQNKYAATYNQQKLAAQQSYDTNDQIYQQQLTSLADDLKNSQQEVIKSTADSAASANRYNVTRGMARASFATANNARIQSQGIGNLAKLQNQYSSNVGSIQAKRTQLAQQLADTLAQYEIDNVNKVNTYIDEQKQLDYDRKVAADKAYNDIQMALYQYSRM